MPQITPNNLAFAANGVFTTGGSVTFGYENVPGDPEAPATLKGIFVDEAQTVAALNPQPLDSDAKYQQSATGILYGPGTYSVLVRNSLGVQVAYNPSYSGAMGEAATYDVGTGAGEIPLNSNLGTSATKDTGTGTTQIPLNSDLGTSSTKDTGTADDNIQVVGPGSIINKVVYQGTTTTTEESVGATIPLQTSIGLSYTPKRNDSSIEIKCTGTFAIYRPGSPTELHLEIQLKDGTSILKEEFGISYFEADYINRAYLMPNMGFIDRRAGTSTRNYSVWLKAVGATDSNISFVPKKGQAVMTVTEFIE